MARQRKLKARIGGARVKPASGRAFKLKPAKSRAGLPLAPGINPRKRAPSAPPAPSFGKATFTKPKAPKMAAPKTTSSTGATSQKPAAPDPRDATYWTQLAQLKFQRDQEAARLTQEQSYADADFAEALRRRVGQFGEQKTEIKQVANQQGLFESGQLGKRLGAAQTAYDRANFDAQTAHDRESAARAAAREALAAGYTLDEAAAMAEAADRQLQRDLANPPAAPAGGGAGGGGGPAPPPGSPKGVNRANHYNHPVVRQTRARAQKLWKSGTRGGPKWGEIISILGYDPRRGGRLHFET